MSDEKPKHPKADAQMTDALARWDSEGGAPHSLPQAFRDGTDGLADSERHVLQCLGAAVVIAWNDLSTEVQRAILRHASADKEPYDSTGLKARIARFLHDHKDDVGDR
jgi:hypothetical protein